MNHRTGDDSAALERFSFSTCACFNWLPNKRVHGLQVIDDTQGHTLAAASSLTPEIREKLAGSVGSNVEAAKLVGLKIAEICKQHNIEQVGWQQGWSRTCPLPLLYKLLVAAPGGPTCGSENTSSTTGRRCCP